MADFLFLMLILYLAYLFIKKILVPMGYFIGGISYTIGSFLIRIILVLLAIHLVYLLIVKILIPAGSILGGVALIVVSVVALFIGSYTAIVNYIKAVGRNIDFTNWTWEKGDEPARRSYFFGPGYNQLSNTINDAFNLNSISGDKVSETARNFKGDEEGILGGILSIFGLVYLIIANICIYGIGTILSIIFFLIHGTFTTFFMLITYIIFSLVWLADRIYLIINRIKSDCPECHSRFLIPMFLCPNCGVVHKKLVPNTYGIFHHKCECSYELPSTFFTGRSELEAYCPDCSSPLVASDARPVVFQLIGGTTSGKTVYLSAFFHKFFEILNQRPYLSYEIGEGYENEFDNLEEYYSGMRDDATSRLNSQMYPVIIHLNSGAKRQFSIYDIAGEMFDGHTADSVTLQKQFHYCDGLLFILDPFSSGYLRDSRDDYSGSVFSNIAVEDVVTNFVNYLVSIGHKKANIRSSIPISVLITKADIREVKREIGPVKIANIYKKKEYGYETYDDARDGECRKFLIDIGLSAVVENLETEFSNLHYFPVSAIGHEPDGSEFEPWGITEPINWMLSLADKELSSSVDLSSNDNY